MSRAGVAVKPSYHLFLSWVWIGVFLALPVEFAILYYLKPLPPTLNWLPWVVGFQMLACYMVFGWWLVWSGRP